MEGSGRDLFEKISSQLPGETVEFCEKPGGHVRTRNSSNTKHQLRDGSIIQRPKERR